MVIFHSYVSLSGKQPHFAMKNHHAINGKTHYFDWAIFNSYVTNYQRVNHVEPLCTAIFLKTLLVVEKKCAVHGKIYNGALNTKYRRVPVDFALS